jgi:alpha-galactosidase
MRLLYNCLVTYTILFGSVFAGNNGLALTPPLSWRSWNAFGWQISAETMRIAANGLIDTSRAIIGRPSGTSLLDLGFNSVGQDEGWAACAPQPGYPSGNWMFHKSNVDGSISPVVNQTLFPDMKGLVEEIHSKGLQVGWYLNPCFSYCWKLGDTCGDECNAGDVIATLTYGFDSVKIDGCSSQHNMSLWSQLFNDSGVPILIENCHDDNGQPEKPISEGGCEFYHTYRSSTDIRNTYGSWLQNAYSVEQYANSGRTGPSCWAYPDMLMIGVGSTCAGDTCASDEPPLPTIIEQRTHYGLWSILSSPLTLSMNFANSSLVDSVWDIVTNVNVIAVNQAWTNNAPGGQLIQNSSTLVLQHCTPGWAGDKNCTVPISQSWYKPLPGGAVALFIANNDFNIADSITIPFSSLPAGSLPCSTSGNGVCDLFNVWEQKQDGQVIGSFTVNGLASHDSSYVIVGPWSSA